nr:hypothetical protein [Tanacetum cinerariifolium]
MFSIVTYLVYGIIYENSKKENRVMRHQEIHKFCDATLKRVLEGLKSYNNDVKYGYVTSSLSKEDVTDDDVLPNEKVSQEIVIEISQTVDEAKLSKKDNSGPEKIVLSLHKFPAVIFPDDDIEERTSIWVDKCVKRFNPYAQYGVEHWKNPHAKIFYIKKQQELIKPKEEIYSNSKIIQVIKTYWKLGYEHKFITEVVARRANGSIVFITKSDYKNLNKNDIKMCICLL